MAYWVSRFIGYGGDRARTLRFDPAAAGLFAMVLMFDIVMILAQKQAGGWLAAAFGSGWPLLLAGFAALLAAMALELYLAVWKAGAALGNPHLGIDASIRIMRRNIPWSFAFTLAMFFPVMILHYLLNGLAIGAPRELVLALLALDSLVVGYPAVLFPATSFLVARRAASRAGVELAAGPPLRQALPA